MTFQQYSTVNVAQYEYIITTANGSQVFDELPLNFTSKSQTGIRIYEIQGYLLSL